MPNVRSDKGISRSVNEEAIAEIYRITRKIRNDSTITIDKVCYDVPMQFISAKIDIRYLPNDIASAYILFDDKKFPIRQTNRLNYLKDIRGIGGFTARLGMGKSYTMRCFATNLNPSLCHMEYLCISTISVADFYKQLCAILSISDKVGNTGMFQAIQG